jgi:DNA/RNA endonuclease YhcR with UshA esterase domain
MRKFNKLFFLFIALFFSYHVLADMAYAQTSLSPEDAYKHIGETQTVCGTVASTYYSIRSKAQPTFLNLNKPYPNQIFTIVIWGSDRPNFSQPPETMYKNCKVCVTGKITTYRNKPQIVVKDPSQIQIK